MSAGWVDKAIARSADPERAKRYFQLVRGGGSPAKPEELGPERLGLLAALVSGSQAIATLLLNRPELTSVLDPESLRFARRKEGLQKEMQAWLVPLIREQDFSKALARVREFHQRERLRIAARDLGRLARLPEVILEISNVADLCLDAIWRICWEQLVRKHGSPWHQDASGRWRPTTGCVLGMGKLGGQELNYSSDVDLLFTYTEEGEVHRQAPGVGSSPRPALTNHQFFNRLAEAFIAEVTRIAPEGVLYRIDMRLRPEGDSGPLNRSLASYENYYAQWGQTWERMMLIKARGVAGDPALAAEFLETIQPFRYPRSINQNVLNEVAAMKDRIEQEVVRAGELERNVKLGRGGIREIEFIAQSQQLLHAGRQPFLQGARTLPCLEKLVQYDLLSAHDAQTLADAYCFLRDIEHRLQMEDDRQTHTIPEDLPARRRLAALMGCASLKEFEALRKQHTEAVQGIFKALLRSDRHEAEAGPQFPPEFENAETEWKQILVRHGFKDEGKAFRVLREFVEGPGYVHVSPRTVALARQLLPRLFALCPRPNADPGQPPGHPAAPGNRPPLSDPDRVVTRLDSFISAYGARSTLFDLWNSNPGIFELLLLLFDRSEFLAELAIRTPDLVDELVTSGRLRQRKTAQETLRDLRHGLSDADQHLWLRRYHQAELMRIGLRDILGLADEEQYLVELSALAEACLQYALEVVSRRHKLKSPPFAVIGMGKVGGGEIDYGSDLDIVFVASPKSKSLARLSRYAVDLMDLVSSRTEQGVAFQTDARLRPDGQKGMLVNTLPAYEEYYRNRAQLWEIQSLTRARFVAGDAKTGRQFEALAATLANLSPSGELAARLGGGWRAAIHAMRLRIEHERTPRGKDELAIKTGKGGLVDAEFVAQALCLANGWHEPNTLKALQRAAQAGVLSDADKLIDNYRRLRRVEGILRRWSYESESVLPDDPAPYYRVSVRCGFATPEEFRSALRAWRQAIREVYSRVFADA